MVNSHRIEFAFGCWFSSPLSSTHLIYALVDQDPSPLQTFPFGHYCVFFRRESHFDGESFHVMAIPELYSTRRSRGARKVEAFHTLRGSGSRGFRGLPGEGSARGPGLAVRTALHYAVVLRSKITVVKLGLNP